ncbi:MAG: matrixin family metalloprotease [Planctomycetes bacterium]|nr:matrixin family metalloprotease [Planctomycetota bacterium]
MTRFAKAVALLLGVGILAFSGEPAQGYMSTRVPSGGVPSVIGKPIRWNLDNPGNFSNVANRRIRYEIAKAGCADEGGFTGPVDEFEAIQNSFARWRRIEASEIDFEFIGATDNAVTDADDGRNVIHFLGANVTAGVFATTLVTFNSDTGEITDADMEINDRDFTWDTIGDSATTGPVGRAIIESVITHEIGHICGLDHPQNSQATMFFASGSGLINQSTLEHDDLAPIVADYPHPTFTMPELGTVSGTVRNSGIGEFGVAVALVDVATGKNVIGHVTEKPPVSGAPGEYTVAGVPPGNYFVFAQPLDSSRLGAYYNTAFTNFFPVVRGVAVGVVGAPAIVRVAPGADVTGVDVDLAAAGANPFPADDTTAAATPIASGQVAVSVINPPAESDFFKFDVPGARRATIRVVSDAFGLTLNPTLTLYSTDGATVLASPQFGHPAFMQSASDIDGDAFDITGVNYDAEIVFDLPGAGTYFMQVQSRLGVTSGQYVITLEISDDDTTADPAASGIATGFAGLAAGTAATSAITVTPRNMFGRDLIAPLTFTVDLIDRTGGGTVVLDTITAQSAPFVFTVAANATPAVKLYGMRINSAVMDATVQISHYGSFSAANSRIRCTETSMIANEVDEGLVVVDLRDAANNPFLEPTFSVKVSTNLGTLDNGADEGAADIVADFDAARRAWVIVLRAPTGVGTAGLSGKAGPSDTALGGTASVPMLKRASTADVPDDGGDDDDNKDDGGGGGCAAGDDAGLFVLVLLLALLASMKNTRRLRSDL